MNRPQRAFRPLPPERRDALLRETLASAPAREDTWVFGYGSLMWNPCFRHLKRRAGTLHGYARRFGIWTTRARGTPENPGIGLCLEEGAGPTHGVVFHIDPAHYDTAMRDIWEREMFSGIYDPRWLPVTTETREVTALTFVVNREHPQYTGKLTRNEVASAMAHARGKYGSCRDYLAHTVAEIKALGVHDEKFERLLAHIDERRGAP